MVNVDYTKDSLEVQKAKNEHNYNHHIGGISRDEHTDPSCEYCLEMFSGRIIVEKQKQSVKEEYIRNLVNELEFYIRQESIDPALELLERRLKPEFEYVRKIILDRKNYEYRQEKFLQSKAELKIK